METEEYRKALLSRVRKVAPWGAEAIVRHIFAKNTSDKIKKCVNGSDAYIHALIDETKKSMESMEPRARSLGHEFPPPSWESQSQSSDTSDRTQVASVGQIGTSQLPSLSNAPDDGMCDFQDPSFNSQGQSSGTSIGLQSAPTGQTVTSQIPVDKSIGSKEHSQSSSVPRCSNGIGCLPSSSRPWPKICHFYMRHGFCKKDLWCEYSHGFGLSGKLEMEIRQLLWWIQPPAVEDLTWIYHECYKKDLPVGPILDPHSSLPNLLQSLHTICLVPGRDGRDFVVLLEHYEACMSYSADIRDREVLKFEGPNQIYIRFSPASRSICPENVYHYFSKYGPVLFVTIPHQSSFGFVRFRYPGTVRLLLSEWNPQVPHFILGEAVRVSRYIPKGEAKLKWRCDRITGRRFSKS